jgi:sporulation-control protein spo0M
MITFLKKTFNISGCEITINPERSIFHQGDEVKCNFTIMGSEYEQTADEITISLEESWQESRGSGDNQSTVTIRKDIVTSVVGANLIIKPGDSHHYEFTAQLPPNCRLSDSSDSLGWCMVVKIDVPRAKDPVERLSIEVVPHREFLAIEHSLQTVLNRSTGSLARGTSILTTMHQPSESDESESRQFGGNCAVNS